MNRIDARKTKGSPGQSQVQLSVCDGHNDAVERRWHYACSIASSSLTASPPSPVC